MTKIHHRGCQEAASGNEEALCGRKRAKKPGRNSRTREELEAAEARVESLVGADPADYREILIEIKKE